MDDRDDELRDRGRQARALRAMAARLEAGAPALPLDVFGPVERELDLLVDDEAIGEAWAEQGPREAEPWVFTRGRILG